jgi:decaprenyl-phosphate phosphoribosyltransferase
MGSVASGLVAAARPRQWIKNGLVVAAPLASGTLLKPQVLGATVVAFISFCFAASAIYLVNDVQDAEADRQHPTKCLRPVAAGTLAPKTALIAAFVLAVAAIGVSLLAESGLVAVVASYIALQLGYVFFLKHEPVLDLAVIASGFLLRSIAGGVAAGIDLSQWFLLVTSFGSLFMVAGKRYSEIQMVVAEGVEIGVTRQILREYSPSYLRFVWSIASAGTIVFYTLWAFEIRGQSGALAPVLSIVPFVLGILRYARDVDSGSAGEPEDVVLRDRVLQVLGLVWVSIFAIGVLTSN